MMQQKLKGWKIWIFSISLLLTAGCGLPQPQPQPELPFYTGVDDSGQMVTLAKKPEHIVSLNLGTDEILFELVEPARIAALSYLAADEGLSSIKTAAEVIPKLKSRNPEAILALGPDLVLAADGIPEEVTATLREAGVPVFLSKSPQSVEAVFVRIEKIGRIAGRSAKAGLLQNKLRQRLLAVQKKTAQIPAAQRRTVLAFSFSGPFGREGGMFDDMYQQAGIKNGAAALGLTKNQLLSKEQVVALDPDVILLPDWSQDKKDPEIFRKQFTNDPAYQKLKALHNGCLLTVPDRYRYSASQYAVEAVEVLSRTIYPQVWEGGDFNE